ncbi:MAG: SWIM zinc finger family protein [Anaerolineae bacterium]
MISKIQKAKRYAEERERIAFDEFSVTFKGDHDAYHVMYRDGQWSCQCQFFLQRGICSHTMAMERILEPMLRLHEEAQV